MAHTFEELKHKTVVELREIAAGSEHEAVKGATQMNKDHLLKVLCTALGIEAHAHHEVVGIDKAAVKGQIRVLKKRRDEILASKNLGELHGVLRQIHALKAPHPARHGLGALGRAAAESAGIQGVQRV